MSQLIEPKVVCPHCWHRFYADEACYISAHPSLTNDEVLPGQQKRYAARAVPRNPKGQPIDEKGWPIAERACPVCHLQMPLDLLLQPPVFVSVVGAPRSGKTYFITSMIHGLREELPRHFGYTLADSDSHDITTFLEHERALFHADDPTRPTFLQKTQEYGHLYHLVNLDGVDVQLPRPFIFAMRPTEMNVDLPKHGNRLNRDIVIYDNAGESFNFMADRDHKNRVTQHLSESQVILFTFDPLQEVNARSRLSMVSDDPQLTVKAVTNRQESTLAEVVNRIRRHRRIPSDQRIDSVLGFCVQKFDVWRELLPHGTVPLPNGATRQLLDHSSVEWDHKRGVGRLDIPEINIISLIVRSFIEDLCPQLVAYAEANFRCVRYFPVSALGTSPQLDANAMSSDDMLKVQPQHIQPFRVTHPMLWVLQQHGLIRRVHRGEPAPTVPLATIQQVTPDRIRVLSPTSQRTYMLDHEYADSTVFDPYCGQWMTIPPIPTLPAVQPPAPAAPPPQPTRPAPTLSIDPPRPRRGWFRK